MSAPDWRFVMDKLSAIEQQRIAALCRQHNIAVPLKLLSLATLPYVAGIATDEANGGKDTIRVLKHTKPLRAYNPFKLILHFWRNGQY